MWVYKTRRSEDKQMVLFIFENTRAHSHAKNHLKGYTRIVQIDGYHAYDKLEGIEHTGALNTAVENIQRH